MTDGNITVFENDTAFLLVTTGDWAHKEISKNLLIFLMLALCCITTVGNICVIYKYRKASYVSEISNFLHTFFYIISILITYKTNLKGWQFFHHQFGHC